MAVLVNNRTANAKTVQELLTRFGCSIKMRLGLHEISNVCAEDGLIILQLGGPEEDIKKLEDGLNALKGVQTEIIRMESE